jgi:hypothetical protein
MKAIRVLRRRDAHHIFYGWNPVLAQNARLEEAWLNPATRETTPWNPDDKSAAESSTKKSPRKVRAKPAVSDPETPPSVATPAGTISKEQADALPPIEDFKPGA